MVTAYGDGGFRINDQRVDGAVLVMPHEAHPLDLDADSLHAAGDALDPLLAYEPRPEMVLIGTGEKLIPPSTALRTALDQAKLGFDPMDTGAAARTYNVLVSEGRRVAALLLPVGSST